VPTSPSGSDAAAATAERSTRWVAFGHMSQNASVRHVSAADAPRSARTYSGWAPDSAAATKRVPMRAPAAPAASTAATSAGVATPGMPASWIGTDAPTRLVKAVLSTRGSAAESARAAHAIDPHDQILDDRDLLERVEPQRGPGRLV